MPIFRTIVNAALIIAAGWISGCSSSDSDFTAALIGKWGEVRRFDGQRHEQAMELNKDGSFLVTGTKSEGGATMKFAFRGVWRVQDGYFLYTTLSSDPPDFYRAGEEYKDRIVSVSDNEWVMIEESTGQESRARRNPQ
jgi:hypothetical protein